MGYRCNKVNIHYTMYITLHNVKRYIHYTMYVIKINAQIYMIEI